MLRPLRLWVTYLPQLAACYVLGLFGRELAIVLAAKLGTHDELWADVLMPFAGFSRLAAFVGMFLILRSAIPALQRLPRTSAGQVDLFANVVVPFFAIYIGWQMLRDDWTRYAEATLVYQGVGNDADRIVTLDPAEIPVSASAWAFIVGAFVLQHILKWQAKRTPGWFVVLRLYLQVLWVFLTLSFAASQGAEFILQPSKWLSQRRVVVAVNSAKEHLLDEFAPIRLGWAAISALWRIVWDVAAMPLLWLVIAGVIYGVAAGATWKGAARRIAGRSGVTVVERVNPAQARLQRELRQRLAVAPPTLAEKIYDWIKSTLMSVFGKYATIVESAKPILHAGMVPLSAYVLSFVVLAWLSLNDSFYRLQQESGYLVRGFAWVIGWHDDVFWQGPGGLIFLAAVTLVTTLRICLVASMYAFCVERIEAEKESEPAAQGDSPVAAQPITAPGAS